mmetsp:Transcript_33903/g.84997  ORF Transcript_33903/g.84997 Transcript_33903/m.84997 type:complete len:351 (-) Transcript_33903:1320-2372(-)
MIPGQSAPGSVAATGSPMASSDPLLRGSRDVSDSQDAGGSRSGAVKKGSDVGLAGSGALPPLGSIPQAATATAAIDFCGSTTAAPACPLEAGLICAAMSAFACAALIAAAEDSAPAWPAAARSMAARAATVSTGSPERWPVELNSTALASSAPCSAGAPPSAPSRGCGCVSRWPRAFPDSPATTGDGLPFVGVLVSEAIMARTCSGLQYTATATAGSAMLPCTPCWTGRPLGSSPSPRPAAPSTPPPTPPPIAPPPPSLPCPTNNSALCGLSHRAVLRPPSASSAAPSGPAAGIGSSGRTATAWRSFSSARPPCWIPSAGRKVPLSPSGCPPPAAAMPPTGGALHAAPAP